MTRCLKLLLAVLPVAISALIWQMGNTLGEQEELRMTRRIAGWGLHNSAWFPESSMYEKINGKAELYQEFGVVGLLTGTWQQGEHQWDMYLYYMKNARAATGVFLVERPDQYQPIPSAEQAYGTDGAHVSAFGNYYLQLLSVSPHGDPQSVMGLADGIVEARKEAVVIDTGDGADKFGLPDDGQLPDSRSVYTSNAFGYQSLGNVLCAAYEVDGTTAVWFTAGGGTDALSGYANELSRFGGEDIFSLDGAVGGKMFGSWELAAVIGGDLVGVREAGSKSELLKHWRAFKTALNERK